MMHRAARQVLRAASQIQILCIRGSEPLVNRCFEHLALRTSSKRGRTQDAGMRALALLLYLFGTAASPSSPVFLNPQTALEACW